MPLSSATLAAGAPVVVTTHLSAWLSSRPTVHCPCQEHLPCNSFFFSGDLQCYPTNSAHTRLFL